MTLPLLIIRLLPLGRRHVVEGLQQAPVVEPVNPLEGGVLNFIEVAPRSSRVDHLGLVQADDSFRQGIVIRVPHAAHGRLDAGFGEPLCVADRQMRLGTKCE